MPLRETEAIVLRTYRLGEADKIVSLFTRQLGRLRAAATGAQRPKSRYGGMLEPLTYIRLWLFERENRDLLRINSTELLESFFAMQGDYRVQLAAQYIAEAAERFLPEREVNERAFRLLLAVLRALKARREIDRPLLYYNYWLLRLAGFLPQLELCRACGRELAGEEIFCGDETQGFVCSRCRTSRSRKISGEAFSLMEKIRRSPLDAWMASETLTPAVREARHLFETWMEACAERKLVTLDLLAAES
jgi:DNA repair protein RecO (recombination protein O)